MPKMPKNGTWALELCHNFRMIQAEEISYAHAWLQTWRRQRNLLHCASLATQGQDRQDTTDVREWLTKHPLVNWQNSSKDSKIKLETSLHWKCAATWILYTFFGERMSSLIKHWMRQTPHWRGKCNQNIRMVDEVTLKKIWWRWWQRWWRWRKPWKRWKRIEYNDEEECFPSHNMKMWIASRTQHVQNIFMRMSAWPHGPRAWELETVSS